MLIKFCKHCHERKPFVKNDLGWVRCTACGAQQYINFGYDNLTAGYQAPTCTPDEYRKASRGQ